MEENKRGGKRVGAGRKSLPITQKRVALTLYPLNADLYKFGSKEKMTEELLLFIANYETKAEIKDLTKATHEIKPFEPPKTNYSVDTTPKPIQPLQSKFDGFKTRILATTLIQEVEKLIKEIKSELFLTVGEKRVLEQIAKEHSKTMYND